MKKLFFVILIVLLAVTMTACKKEAGKDSGNSTDSGLSSDSGQDISNFPEIDTNVYYVEAVELKSDPGDNLSASDGAKAVWNAVKESGLPNFAEGLNIYISLRGLEFIDEEDRYIYTLGTGTEYEKDDYTTLYDLSVNYLGDVFSLSGESGDWEPFGAGQGDVTEAEPITGEGQDNRENTVDPGPGDPGDTMDPGPGDPGDTTDPGPGDPGDTNTPEWWGQYKGDWYSVEIYNFDMTGFQFTIYNLRNGHSVFEGFAALYPDNPLMAEYGQLSFSLYEDYTALDIFAPESGEYSDLRGQYMKLD